MRAWLVAAALGWAGASAAACPDYTRTGLLRQLEPAAGRGALPDEEVGCLDEAYARASKLTLKNKISLYVGWRIRTRMLCIS